MVEVLLFGQAGRRIDGGNNYGLRRFPADLADGDAVSQVDAGVLARKAVDADRLRAGRRERAGYAGDGSAGACDLDHVAQDRAEQLHVACREAGYPFCHVVGYRFHYLELRAGLHNLLIKKGLTPQTSDDMFILR